MGKEMVKVDLDRNNRIVVKSQIDAKMEDGGIAADDFAALDLGFEVPEGWPADKDCELTLAELVVVAGRLGMQIVITEIELRKV